MTLPPPRPRAGTPVNEGKAAVEVPAQGRDDGV